MAEHPGDLSVNQHEAPIPRWSRRRCIAYAVAALIALIVAAAWINRSAIVDRIIAGQLSSLGVPGQYRLESAGVGKQVLTDIVIGDPAHPDLTIERAEVVIVPTFGLPTVGKVTLLRPRLHGTVRQARASFGSLDKLLFGKAAKPRGLPDLELVLVDGRARLDTDYGAIGLKADGRGNLSGGFAGVLAVAAPQLVAGSQAQACRADHAMLWGRLAVIATRPTFFGTAVLGALDCPARGLRQSDLAVQLTLDAAQTFDSFAGRIALTSRSIGLGALNLGRLMGQGNFSFAAGDLTARYRLA
ncbi:MAG: hypothetical protein RIQ99_2078, partial [Pseudomonadota bacterium]